MATDIIETALSSALEELERVKKSSEHQQETLHRIEERLDKMEGVLKETKQSLPKPLNMAPIEAAITKGITRIEQTIEAQPKTVVHQRRILLFPEYGAQEYYRIVFGRLIFWMVVVLMATYLFVLGKEAVEKWSVINNQEMELNEYKKVWLQLYKETEKKNKGK